MAVVAAAGSAALAPGAAHAGRCGSTPCVADVGISGHAEPQPVHPGERSAYKFTAKNNGPDGALSIELQATIPSGLRILRATAHPSGSCSVRGTFVDCRLGDFRREQEAVVVVAVRAIRDGTWIAPAKVYSSDVNDPNGGNNQVSATLGVFGTPVRGGFTRRRRHHRSRR